MKLFRHGAVGCERAGALDGRGVKRDLSLLVPDITPDWLAPEKLRAIASIDLAKTPAVPEGERIGATALARAFSDEAQELEDTRAQRLGSRLRL